MALASSLILKTRRDAQSPSMVCSPCVKQTGDSALSVGEVTGAIGFGWYPVGNGREVIDLSDSDGRELVTIQRPTPCPRESRRISGEFYAVSTWLWLVTVRDN